MPPLPSGGGGIDNSDPQRAFEPETLRSVGIDAQPLPGTAGWLPWLLAAGVRERELHATVLRLARRRIVGGDRIGLAEALSRDEVRLDAVRDHVLHHVVSPPLRQDEIGRGL